MMKISDLTAIYPTAKVVSQPTDNSDLLNFELGNKWIVIPAEGLSLSEIALIKLLIGNQSNAQTLLANSHQWFRRLFLGERMETAQQQQIRIIQIEIINQDPTVTVEKWLEAFKSMFEKPLLDAFLVSQTTAIAIEPLTDQSFDNSEFLGISQTLDNDFYCKSKLYIGQYWLNDGELSTVFNSERKLFKFQLQQNTSRRIFSVANSILKYCFEEQLSDNPWITKSKHELATIPDASETISALYQSGGNVSTTAKQLYLHRNTLQYRIKKFQEVTGFNLKDMNDLLFCYLLTFK